VDDKSPSAQIKQVDSQVNRILKQAGLDEMPEKGRKAVIELRQNLIDAKIYSQDYELSEMREEQIDNAKKAKKWLERARGQILRASEFDVFGPVDVAHLTAQIDQAEEDLK
jgi:hypothetical protein